MSTTQNADEQLRTSTEYPEACPNGMTEEQLRDALAAIGRRKNDPGYLERLLHGAQDARRRINAEFLRELDAGEEK